MSTHKKILILGGGYAGMMTALRLWNQTRKLSVEITLVNSRPEFIERVRNHQRAAGNPVPEHHIANWIEGTDIQFVTGWVSALKPDEQQVLLQTEAGESGLSYDYLVYALGSQSNGFGLKGSAEHTIGLDADPALELALQCQSGKVKELLIIGSGNTGVELSTEIAEAHPELNVTLASRERFAPNLSAVSAGDKSTQNHGLESPPNAI